MTQRENYVEFELIPSVEEGNIEDDKVEIQLVTNEFDSEEADKIIFQLVSERDEARSEIDLLKAENDELRKQMTKLQISLSQIMTSNNILFNKLNEIQSVLDRSEVVTTA